MFLVKSEKKIIVRELMKNFKNKRHKTTDRDSNCKRMP